MIHPHLRQPDRYQKAGIVDRTWNLHEARCRDRGQGRLLAAAGFAAIMPNTRANAINVVESAGQSTFNSERRNGGKFKPLTRNVTCRRPCRTTAFVNM
jgi:hypothetical protein